MLVNIERRGSKAIIKSEAPLPTADIDAVRKALAYKDAGNAYLNKRRGKAIFATDFSAFDPTTMSLPAGLMPRVRTLLQKRGHAAMAPGFDPPEHSSGEFTRPYQEAAAKALLEHYCGHVSIPTGGGKTHVIGEVVSMLDERTVVVVPSIEILDQVNARLDHVMGERVNRLGGKDVLTDSHVLVGTYQTLISRIDANETFLMRFLDGTAAVIVDECHHTPCDSIGKIIDAGRTLRWSYGLSATPYRKDGLEILMEGAVGPLRYQVTPTMLRDGGYIVGGDVTMFNVPAVGRTGGNPRMDYHKVYRDYLIGSKTRRELEVNACTQARMFGLKTICFTKHVDHATDIYEKTKGLGAVRLLT